MLRLILAYTLGVLGTQWLPALPPGWVGVVALLVASIPWRGRAAALALAAGFALTLWRAEAQLEDQWPVARQNEEVQVQGQIVSLPERSSETAADGAPRWTWRFQFAPTDPALPARIRVSWYRSDQLVRGADCWLLTLRIKTPHGSQNPGGFDYEGWLFRQHIGAVAVVRAAERCDATGHAPILQWRQRLRDVLEAAMPETPARALLIALVLGDDSGLSAADWQAFRLTGTTHLIAISGFNLAIVAGCAFFLLRWLWAAWPMATRWMPAQRAAAVGAAVIAAGYTALAGAEPPVLRALAMLWVGLAALALHRRVHPFRALALAWGLILLADPFAVLAPGLWLSFGAVAAIFWLAGGRLGREPGWHLALRLQLLLGLLLAPMTLFFFAGTAWIAPFVNLVAVPVFAVLTPLALLATSLSGVSMTLAMPLWTCTERALSWVHLCLQALAETHAAGWQAAAPPAAALGLALLGLVLWAAPRGLPLRPLGLLCLLPLLWPPVQAPTRGFHLTALDVGQGLAVVVRTAQHTLLFDAGPAYEEGFDAGRSVVVPYLLGQGVRQLDRLLISHGDLDHAGGAQAVRELLHPALEQGALRGEPCRAGQQWQWDGVQFRVLQGMEVPGASDNDRSCVLRIETGRYAVLLPADIEQKAEARLLAADTTALRADLLLAPHHGSRSSSSVAFVEAVNPDTVIFAAGFANRYAHPRPEVVARYARLGSAMHMTGHEGALQVEVDPEQGVSAVRAWRQQGQRYWWNRPLPLPHTAEYDAALSTMGSP